MMMSFFLLLNWKNWISFETQKDKKRGILEFERTRTPFIYHHRSTRVEIKGTPPTVKKRNVLVVSFFPTNIHTHTHTHTHTHKEREKEEALYLIDDF